MSVPVARLTGVGLRYGETRALDAVDLEIPAGGMVRDGHHRRHGVLDVG